MRKVTLFRAAVGLNTVVDPARIQHDPNRKELAVAVNVDIDNTGRISRRKGYKATNFTTTCHSLFSTEQICFFVSGNTLYSLQADFTAIPLKTGLTPNARMRYVAVHNGVFFSNGYENGFWRDGELLDWVATEYKGPRTKRNFSDPPIGHLLEYYNGRVWIGQESTLFYTEAFGYFWVDMARNFVPFGGRLSMVRAVDNGLFVGDSRGTYFIAYAGSKEATFRKISSAIVVEGTDISMPGELLTREGINGKVAIWASSDGIIAGLSDGTIKNLTKEKISLPSAATGVSYIFEGKLIVLLNP